MIGPTELRLACRVRGCGEVFRVPVVYREVPVTMPGTFADPHERVIATRVEVDVEGTLALEAPLRAHLERHATDGAPPDELPPDVLLPDDERWNTP